MRIKSKLKAHVIRAVLVLLALAGAARLFHAGYIYSMDINNNYLDAFSFNGTALSLITSVAVSLAAPTVAYDGTYIYASSGYSGDNRYCS